MADKPNKYYALLKAIDSLDERQETLDFERLEVLKQLDEIEPNSNWEKAIIQLKDKLGVE